MLVQSVPNRWVKSRALLPIQENMSVRRFISIALLIALVPVAGYTVMGTLHSTTHATLASGGSNSSLSISASGNSSVIGKSSGAPHSDNVKDQSSSSAPPPSGNEKATTPGSSIQIAASILHSTNGTIRFNVTSGSLVIGSTTYKVDNGTGIFNQHRMIVVVQATVTSGSSTAHLVLKGEATKATSNGEGGTGYDVSFTDPQSKLARHFLLSLDGSLTINA